jgi:hypothetical protein
MPHSKFGWSYPPGCSGPPYDDEGPCEICGKSVEDCICPECQDCGAVGDPHCYKYHGMTLTKAQIESKKEFDEMMKREKECEIEYIQQMQDGLYDDWSDMIPEDDGIDPYSDEEYIDRPD